MAEEGFTVYAPDRRGSGQNAFDRGHIESYEDLIADLDAFLNRIEADHPTNLPIFLVSVSWGGKLAVAYEALRPGRVAGVVLSTPGIKPKVDLNPWNKMKVLYFFWRRRDVQPMIPIPINATSLFTDDVEWQNWIEQDPLTLRECTPRFYWESRQLESKTNQEKD